MNTILKANGKSKSGKTFYFYAEVPAGELTVKEGCFCGTCNKEEATIEEIGWTYSFGKKFFSITKNGKNQLKNYVELIKKFYM